MCPPPVPPTVGAKRAPVRMCVCVCVCVRVRVCMRACVRVHGHEELWDAWELLIKADEGMRERWSLLYFLYGRLCASAENGAVHL